MTNRPLSNNSSTNEELHTVNFEYQSKIQELTELNNAINNLLTSTDIGVLFLDRQLRIRKFTPAVRKTIYIRDTDINRPLEELSYKIECPNLLRLFQDVLENKNSLEKEVKLKQADKYFLMRVNLYQVEDNKSDGIVVSFVNLDEIKKIQRKLQETLVSLEQSERKLQNKETRFRAIFNAIFQFIGLLKPDGILIEINQTALNFADLSLEDVINCPFWKTKWWTISPQIQKQIQKAISTAAKGVFVRYEVDILGAENKIATIDFSLNPIKDETGKVMLLVFEGRDISEIKQAKENLSQLNQQLEQRILERTAELQQANNHLSQEISERTLVQQTLFTILKQQAAVTQLGQKALNIEKLQDLFEEATILLAENLAVEYTKVLQLLPNGEGLLLKAGVGWQSGLVASAIVETDIASQAGYTLISQEPVIVKNLNTETRFSGPPLLRDCGVVSGISTVIKGQEKPFGVLGIYTSKQRYFNQDDVNFVQTVANILAAAIINKDKEAQLRATFEQAAVGIAHLAIDGRFLRLNQRFCQIAGYSCEELLDLNCLGITYSEDLAAEMEYIRQMLAGTIASYSIEKRYVRQDKSTVWVNLTRSIVRDEWGESDYFIAAIQDISEAKQREAEHKQMEIQLQQANQAKNSFITHLNHEIRTPLNGILGFAQLLKKGVDFDRADYQTIELIEKSGEHLLRLINNILNFSKIEAGKIELQKEDFNLSNFLANLIVDIRLRAQAKGIDFQARISPDLPLIVREDKTKLQQILLNLLSNAIKFTDRGYVNLTVKSLKNKNNLVDGDLSRTKNPKYYKIRFQIEDTGIGIPEEKLDDIFLPFERLHEKTVQKEGTGLGLHISQKIVEQMGSEIHVTSKLTKGSTFWFDLNLSEGDSANISTALSCSLDRATGLIGRKRKILVVDDLEDNRKLLSSYLKPLSFEMAEAENGKQCLEIAETFKPDAILVDILMPEMDGIQLLRHIRQKSQLENTVVIFISANPQLESKVQETGIKFQDFIAKPIDFNKLLKSLETHLNLQWEISVNTSKINRESFIAPPSERLIKLLELARLGDIELIQEQTKSLKKLDRQYLPFIQEVENLASSFQQNKLIQFIQSFLDN